MCGRYLQHPPNNAVITGEFQSKFQSSMRKLRARRGGEKFWLFCATKLRCNSPGFRHLSKSCFLDLTNPFDSPHIFKDGRKFSKTPETKYSLFLVMPVLIRGGLGERIWDKFCVTTDSTYSSKLLCKHFIGVGRQFELKAVLIKRIGRFSYV